MRTKLGGLWVGVVGALLTAAASRSADDIVIADFEVSDYGRWKTTGEAFGSGPALGTLPGQMPVDGFKGKGLVNSFHGGDRTTGTLTSPSFQIERQYISFLMGGGKESAKTAMNLLVDGRAVRNATGPNDRPGGTERLEPEYWEVSEWLGKMATIEIVDQATGGWGHINVDHIVQTDSKPAGSLTNPKREFAIEKRYLNFPIKRGTVRKVTVLVDGKVQVRNDIELADAEPEWWAAMDVSEWRGKTLTLQVDKLRENSDALKAIEQSDTMKGTENLYREPLRGQFHFSPRRGWNNDPNGLAFYNGEYHMFFQHNPYGWAWGNMHWGHAVSTDLIHWRELGDVLAPDDLGPMFSGSAVIDWKNTSGLGRDGKPPLILLYTAAGNPTVQCLASSTDGRKFQKFAGNPIVPEFTSGNRDPKVIWHEPSKQWVMTLYVETNKVHSIFFLGSQNLKEWKYLSRNDGFFECPDFFELAVDGDVGRKKWVLNAANSEYMIGSFDGIKFTPETAKLPGHRGKGFYAAQTFSDIPDADGRRIQIGWFQTETKGMPFNQSMTVPLELKLVSTKDGPRLSMTPVKELEVLRENMTEKSDLTLTPDAPNSLATLARDLIEARVEFEPKDAKEVAFEVNGAAIVYDSAKEELVVNGHSAAAPLRNGKQRLIIYSDRMGLEVFASDGLTYVPMPFIAKSHPSLNLQAKGGNAHISNIRVYQLRSAWHPARL